MPRTIRDHRTDRVPHQGAVESAAPLTSFDVTSDSVVATVVLTPSVEHRSVDLHWGDDTVDRIDLRRPRRPSAAGTIRRQHVYDPDAITSRTIVTAVPRDAGGRQAIDAATVTIRPGYRFTIGPIALELRGSHEPFWDDEAEFDLSLDAGVLGEHQWHLVVPEPGSVTQIGPWVYPVADSTLTVELDWDDDPVGFWLRATEDDGSVWGPLQRLADGIPVEFDTSARLPWEIHARHFAETPNGVERFRYEVLGGTVSILIPFDAHLRVPLDRGPEAVVVQP